MYCVLWNFIISIFIPLDFSIKPFYFKILVDSHVTVRKTPVCPLLCFSQWKHLIKPQSDFTTRMLTWEQSRCRMLTSLQAFPPVALLQPHPLPFSTPHPQVALGNHSSFLHFCNFVTLRVLYKWNQTACKLWEFFFFHLA